MTPDEADQYWFPAQVTFEDIPNLGYRRSKALASLLGLAYPQEYYYEHIPLTPKLINTLTALAGPYAVIMRKVLEKRRNKDDTSGENL